MHKHHVACGFVEVRRKAFGFPTLSDGAQTLLLVTTHDLHVYPDNIHRSKAATAGQGDEKAGG